MKKLIITIALILSLTACLPEAMNGNSNDVEKEVKKEQSSNTQKQDKQTEVFDTNIDTSSLEKKDSAKTYKINFLKHDKEILTKILFEGKEYTLEDNSQGYGYIARTEDSKEIRVDGNTINFESGRNIAVSRLAGYIINETHKNKELEFMDIKTLSTKITELTNKLGFESFEINEIYGIDEKTIEEFVKVQNEEVQSRVTKDGTIKLLETDKINDVYIVSLKKKFDRIEVYNGMLSNSRTNSTRFGTDLHLLFDKDGLSKLTLIYDMETTEILKDEKLISGEEILGNVKKELEQLIGVKEPEITSISLCYTTNYVDEIKDFKRMNDRDFHMEIFPQYMVVITQEVDVGDKTITDKIYKFYNAYTGEEIH